MFQDGTEEVIEAAGVVGGALLARVSERRSEKSQDEGLPMYLSEHQVRDIAMRHLSCVRS